MRNLASVKVKSSARYTCQECGSTELIQAHHEIPGDDDSLIALCAECHSLKHPDVPKDLFFSTNKQPYWHNKSAASLARELGVHPKTIIRTARNFNILPGELTSFDEELIKNNIPKLQWLPQELRKPQKSRKLKKLEKLDNLNVNGKRITPYSIYDITRLAYRLNIPWHTVWHWKRKNRPSIATKEKIKFALSIYGSV